MKKAVIILICLLPLVVNAGICDWLFLSQKSLIPGVRPQTLENFQMLQTGAEVEFLYRGKSYQGRIQKLNYEELYLDGKKYEVSKIESPSILSPTLNKVDKLTDLNRSNYLDFLREDYWSSISSQMKKELVEFRKIHKDEQEEYLRSVGNKIIDKIKAHKGTENIGFHFNLHGGAREDYVNAYGIRATQGDVELQYSGRGDPSFRVYFFQSKEVSLFDILNERKDIFSGRMGDSLNIFDLESAYLKKAFEENGATRFETIFIDFDLQWLKKQPHSAYSGENVAIPYSSYLAPPLEIFSSTSKKLGESSLTRHEETLSTMRYIEHIVLTTDWVNK